MGQTIELFYQVSIMEKRGVVEHTKGDKILDLPYFFRDDDLYDLFKECGPIEHFRVYTECDK